MLNKYGIKATTRFGSGILRSNAIAKMTNIKTTLKYSHSHSTSCPVSVIIG